MSAPTQQNYDVFVSYCRNDEALAQRVSRAISRMSAVLPSGPWRVFVDTSELHGGETWYRRIMTALGGCRTFVAVLSPHYLESRMCMEEWDTIATRQVTERTARTFPLLIADCQLAPDMAKTQYLDLRSVEPGSEAFLDKLAGFVADLDRVIAASRGDEQGKAVQAATPEQVREALRQAEDVVDEPARSLLAEMERHQASGEAQQLADSHRSLSRMLGAKHPRVQEWKPLLQRDESGGSTSQGGGKRRAGGVLAGVLVLSLLIGVAAVAAKTWLDANDSTANDNTNETGAHNDDDQADDSHVNEDSPPLTRFAQRLRGAADEHADAETWRTLLSQLGQLPGNDPQTRATQRYLRAAEQALSSDPEEAATLRLHPQAQALDEAALANAFDDETVQRTLSRGRPGNEPLEDSLARLPALHDALRKALPDYNAALQER